jgi:lauroyl/myristoyl acyltransferase
MRPDLSDDTASSAGAKVCSQGRKPLGHERAAPSEPQRGDRSRAIEASLPPPTGAGPHTGMPHQGLAPLATNCRPIRGWADTVGELSAGSARSRTAPPFAALRLVYLRRIVGTAFGAAGLDRATRWGSWIARNLFDLNPPARKRIEANLLTAYGHTLSAAGRERLARAVFDNIARFWIEVIFARRLLKPGSWMQFVRVADPETWQRLAADPRPAIFVSAYFGNVAVGAYALGQIFRPVHVLIDRLELPVLGPWQDELYAERNVRPIAREAAVRDLPRILDAGGKVMILGEHARSTGRAIEVPFLGRMRRCYTTIGVLAARHNARVVVFSTGRLPPPSPPFRFELRCHDMIDSGELARVAWACTHARAAADPTTGQSTDPCHPKHNTPASDVAGEHDPIRAVTERYMSVLEHMIREALEQYDWTR